MSGSGSLSLSDRLQLSKLYRHGRAAYGSINNLVKESGLSRKKVELFLHSKNSYTKYRQAKKKFPRLAVYAKHKNEIWCADLAQVDKLAEWNNGIKYLLVVVDVFSRYVRVETLRNKSAESTKRAYIKLCSSAKDKLSFPKKLWVDKGKEFMADFRQFCEDVGTKVYHTHSETKASYAERAIRSLKNILYRYMEERETNKYYDNLPNFVNTLNSRVNRSIGKAPKDVDNEDVLQILYSSRKPARERRPKFNVGDVVRIAKANIPFKKGYKPQFTEETFVVTNIASRVPVVTYNIMDLRGDNISGKFYESELIKQNV